MSSPSTVPGFAQRADVFLSYARSDLDAARALVSALAAQDIEVALDVTHLMPGEEYAKRLDDLLLASAKVVFFATPASLSSPACKHELELAAKYAKPVLPVLVQGVGKIDLPQALHEVQYLRLGSSDLAPRLAAAIRTDLAWERRHAEYEQLAARGPNATIMQRAAVQEAQDWLAARPANATPISHPVRDLITRSRKRLQRRSRYLLAGLTTAAAAMAVLAIGLFFQWQEAQEQTAQAQSSLGLLFAGEAERLASEFQTDAALLTLLEASEMVAPEETPRIEAVFARMLSRAESERRYTIPGDSFAFEHENTLYYQSPSEGGLWRIAPQTGPVRVSDWPGRLLYTAPVAPVDGFSMIAATERDGGMHVAYIDPTTGQWGAHVGFELPQNDSSANPPIDIGPDGIGVVEVAHNDLPLYYVFDVGRALVSAVDPEEIPGLVSASPRPTLSVDAQARSRIRLYFRDSDTAWPQWPQERFFTLDPDGALTLDPVSRQADSEHRQISDCLARGLFPGDLIAASHEMLALSQSEEAYLYAEPGSSTPPSGHCLMLGDSLIFVGTSHISSGSSTTLTVLERSPYDQTLSMDFELVDFSGEHFRPSLLRMDSGQRALTAINLNEVQVVQSPSEYNRLGDFEPRRFQFPYRVEHAILSPRAELIVLEMQPYTAVLPELRVTVLAPELILEQTDLRANEYDETRHQAVLGAEGPELRFVDGGLLFPLPANFGEFTPLAVLPDPDPNQPVVFASLNHRAVDRYWRDQTGEWQRELLFVAPSFIVTLTMHPNGDLLIVGMSHGGGDVEASVWSLADRREVMSLGETYKWMNFRVEGDGSLVFAQTGAAATSIALNEGRVRATASLSERCQPAEPGVWRTSPCWPGHL